MAASISHLQAPLLPGHEHPPTSQKPKDLADNSQKLVAKETRIEVPFSEPLPYRWICKIKIFDEIKGHEIEIPSDHGCDSGKDDHDTPHFPRPKDGTYKPKKRSIPRYGTGFLINIPHSTRCLVLTAAHNLCFERKGSKLLESGEVEMSNQDTSIIDDKTYFLPVTYAVVRFPGTREPIIIKNTEMMFPPKYACRKLEDGTRWNYDYGIIVLPGIRAREESCGFGISATLTDRTLLSGISLSIFGYPMWKEENDAKSDSNSETPQKLELNFPSVENEVGLNLMDDRELYGTGGGIQSVGPRIIRYFVNTSEGQSGCPVFIWEGGSWTVVGIHVKSEQLADKSINSASRLRVGMLQRLFQMLHDHDVKVYRPSLGSSAGGQDFWYPFWHVILSSQIKPDDDHPDGARAAIVINGPAKKDSTKVETITYHPLPLESPTESEDILTTFAENNKGSIVGILPVRTYSEGNAVSVKLEDNMWVISSLTYEDTFISFDDNRKDFKERISVSSRYRHTPILRNALELVKMQMLEIVKEDKETGKHSKKRTWKITPSRCPHVTLPNAKLVELVSWNNYFKGFSYDTVSISKVGDGETSSTLVEGPKSSNSHDEVERLVRDLKPLVELGIFMIPEILGDILRVP